MSTSFSRRAVAITLCGALCGAAGVACAASPVTFPTTTAWVHLDSDSIPVAVEVARTEAQQARGLSRRSELDPEAGMLFVFDEVRPDTAGFWMWQTEIPLDVAVTDREGVILEILGMEPCASPVPDQCTQYIPGVPHWFALEVNRGWFSRHGIDVGARLTFDEEER